MRPMWFGVVLAGVLAISNPAYAQQGRGDNEVQLQASLTIGTSSSQNNSGSVNAGYGYFFTDLQQIGADVTVSIFNQNKLAGYGGPFYRYNFSTGKVVPYLGLSAAAAFGSQGNGKGALVNGEAGVRYFLDRRTALTASATTAYSFDQKAFTKNIVVLVGFSHLWKR
jgi:hypothetical protein